MSPDVLIIGAGVSGLASAIALSSAGLGVKVLERGPVARESTWAGAGILSLLLPWHYPEPINALAERGHRLWPAWLERLQGLTGLDAEYVVSGLLVLDAGERSEAQAWAERHDLRVEPPPSALLRSFAPPDAGVWLPEVAQVRNPRLARLLEAAARQMGVELLPHTPVLGLNLDRGRVLGVRTASGSLDCGRVVVCAGAWSPDLLGTQGLGLDIRPVRGQILLLRARPGLLPCIVWRKGRYLVPRTDGRVLAGSTLEEVGFDKSTTATARQELLQFVTETCPGLHGAQIERQWAGLRPGSPGNLPTIGPHPHIAGLYVNSGHFRYGLTMAPAAAELLTSLMLGRESTIDPSPYAWPSCASNN